MSEYRRDPETGKVYAFGGLIVPGSTLDERRAEREDFRKVLARRAGELPHKRPSWRQRDRSAWLLGGVRRAVDGKVACSECQTDNRADSDFCQNCGAPLIALEGYQGVQAGDSLKCEYCYRMNDPANHYCTGCGRNLAGVKAEESKSKELWPRYKPRLPQHDAPVVFARPVRHARDGVESSQVVEARESFSAIDPRTHQVVQVRAGRTRVPTGSWLHKVRPSAFQFV